MTSAQIRYRFLEFFKNRGHAVLPSASLVPRNDPSVLFNTAGMQPLVPYLMGEPHPQGVRLASCQKCVRTGDIEEVGNNKNLTFFEMLGNWSLGDYFKEDAIKWSYEFLTSKEEGLGLDPSRLYVTVFEGDENAPRDMEAVEIWKNYISESRIYFLPAENNWWSPGENGPCGPDTEMFYDVTPVGLGEMTHEEYAAADARGDVVEIWNDVFMEYEKRGGVVTGKLSKKNVDTGSGLERITMVVQGKSNVYETDLFAPALAAIEQDSERYDERGARIIADHIKAALFLLSEGLVPGSKDQGYILRRLIRRAVMQSKKLGLAEGGLERISKIYQEIYKDQYPEVVDIRLVQVLTTEQEKFKKTLDVGLKEFEKRNVTIFVPTIYLNRKTGEGHTKEPARGELYVSGETAFLLYTSYGFPIELIIEEAKERAMTVDIKTFKTLLGEHQDKSRAGAEQKFKGGLANSGEQTTKLHTAHHLLLAALQQVLGKEVKQRGSNITEERLRIDFSFDRKMTEEEKQKVETLVNDAIANDYAVIRREMPRDEAEKIGAEMEFGTKYPDMVSVYFIEDKNGAHFSKEFCGGPHVTHTGVLGTFKIQKEEAVAAGVRRIKAVLTDK